MKKIMLYDNIRTLLEKRCFTDKEIDEFIKELIDLEDHQLTMEEEMKCKVSDEVRLLKDEDMYPKSEIIAMMKRRVERSHKCFFERYGVNSITELDELVGRIKS